MNRLAASRTAPPPRCSPVDYPDSDGQPVAETDFQRIPLWYANDALARYFRDQEDVYVSANMFLYYEEGNPRAVVAPDVFVVVGTPKGDRRSYKLWEEPKGPDFVLEITSHSTRTTDQGPKRRIYAELGVLALGSAGALRESGARRRVTGSAGCRGRRAAASRPAPRAGSTPGTPAARAAAARRRW